MINNGEHKTGRKSIYGVWGGGDDTNWQQVKGINKWEEQKTGLRWPQRDTKDKKLKPKETCKRKSVQLNYGLEKQ